MLKKFRTYITTHLPFLRSAKLLIACSGGIDSVVLTDLCKKEAFDFALAHCNFKLRGTESDDDAHFVSDLAKKYGIPLYATSFETKNYTKTHKMSIQMAARELRYEWFQKLVLQYQYDYVLTAHHKDDNLETFLINLSRGTGIDGLTGIPEINDIYIRPLLSFSREQIQKYAKEEQILWREDSSNSSTKYVRNKLRHDVIPELKTIAPDFLNNFTNTIKNLQHTQAFIDQQIDYIKKQTFETISHDEIRISIQRMQEFGQPDSYLFFLLRPYGFTAWDDILEIIDGQSGKQIFSPSHRLVKDRIHLLLSPIRKNTVDRKYEITEAESTVMLPLGVLKLKEVQEISDVDLKTVYLDKEKLKYPLTVRKWKQGDYFYPLGMKGKKKLSKYFKDEKLSLLAKERVWLLCSGKEIVWIMNYRADDRFKVASQTKTILKISIT